MRSVQFPWALSIEEVCKTIDNTLGGLSATESKKRHLDYGANVLASKKTVPWYIIFLEQFANPLIYILILAAVINAVFKGPLDAAVIGAVLLFMAIIGFIQEMKARKAMEALLNLSSPKAKVLRNGVPVRIDAAQTVPGDILIIEAGDRIAADARLFECASLKVNESPFTGESLPVEKSTFPVDKGAPIHDRGNMVFMGTTASSGRGVAVVTATGIDTEIGKIADAIRSVKKEKTPLQKAVDDLGNSLVLIVPVACALLFIAGILHGDSWVDVFLLAVAAAVSGIPEGLPASVTVVLAVCVGRMSQRNVIIHKLTAIETLGTTTVICTDKTGTLTLNEMTVREIWSDDGLFEVSGVGYEPIGEFRSVKEVVNPNEHLELKQILRTALLCNDAILIQKGSKWDILGDPTEGAVITAAGKAGLKKDELENLYPRLEEIPFESEKQFMATLHVIDDIRAVCIKGSLEKVLVMCRSIQTSGGEVDLTDEMRGRILAANETMAKKALRVLAAAAAPYPDSLGKLSVEKFSGHLVFLGLIGMIDPPREEAGRAVQTCKEAGIRVVMITGDNPVTASAIASDLGFSDSTKTESAVTGKDIEAMDDKMLVESCRFKSVFARIEPLHKLRIVKSFKSLGHITAMTGDGVNDAPALENADIGVAMGITGTDVAKEAADMILADDNFASIVKAVEEGRIVFNRLRNVAFFLLLTCAAELITLLISVAFYGEAPFEAIQILWINLVTGSLAAIPLGLESGTGKELSQSPRDPRVGILYSGMILRLFFYAIITAALFTWVFHHAPIPSGSSGEVGHSVRQTVTFTAIVLFEWLFVFHCRSSEKGVLKIGVFRNKGLLAGFATGISLQFLAIYLSWANNALHTYPLTLADLAWCFFPGITIFLIESIRKILFPGLFSRGELRLPVKR